MDFDNVKTEKANALHRFQNLQTIRFLFRLTEISLALLFLSYIFTSFPFAVQIFRRLTNIISTPLFMFVLGNSIIIALLTTTKSSVVFSTGDNNGGDEADIYEAFIRRADNACDEENIIYDDKQMIAKQTDTNLNYIVAREDHVNSNSTMAREVHVITETLEDDPPKVYRRSKSEITAKQSPVTESKPLLMRSETEKCREMVKSCEEVCPFEEDNMSNEEFQKTIEAFIAKQLVFRRQESLAVVIRNG